MLSGVKGRMNEITALSNTKERRYDGWSDSLTDVIEGRRGLFLNCRRGALFKRYTEAFNVFHQSRVNESRGASNIPPQMHSCAIAFTVHWEARPFRI